MDDGHEDETIFMYIHHTRLTLFLMSTFNKIMQHLKSTLLGISTHDENKKEQKVLLSLSLLSLDKETEAGELLLAASE